jgi:hypothetical protein
LTTNLLEGPRTSPDPSHDFTPIHTAVADVVARIKALDCKLLNEIAERNRDVWDSAAFEDLWIAHLRKGEEYMDFDSSGLFFGMIWVAATQAAEKEMQRQIQRAQSDS